MSDASAAVLRLLEQTVRQARSEVDFYEKSIPAPLSFDTLQDFTRVPVIARDDLARLSRDLLLSAPAQPYAIGLTSGSSYTRDTPFLYRLRSRDEADALATLYAGLIPRSGCKPIVLHLINANHGAPLVNFGPGQIALPLEQPYHLDVIIDMLGSRFAFEGHADRITSIIAPLQALKILTSRLIEDGIECQRFAIAHLTTFAWRLTPHWRSRFEAYWQVPVTDIYGMSEVPGLSAQSCPHCRWFHFSPTAHIEMLSPHGDNRPVREGVARLVATSFYPLAEIMPVIRYDTGDYFHLRGPCAHNGKPGYEFLGRRSQLIATPNHAAGWISTGILADALDGFPEIARIANPRLSGLGVKCDVGSPAFSVQLEDDCLRIGVRLAADLDDRQAATLRDAATRSIAMRLAAYGSELPSDSIAISLATSGDIEANRFI